MDFRPLTDAPAPLRAFVEQHRADLERLGCAYLTHYAEQVVRPGFTKYVLGQMPDSRWAMLHHLTSPDPNPTPHDHPCAFEAHILAGGYVERNYWRVGSRWHSNDEHRLPGTAHTITPERIHTLLALPAGECWSLCFAGPAVQQAREYPEALTPNRNTL